MSGDEIERLRERLAAVDLALVRALNERLLLVAELKRAKEQRGIPFLDPDREAYMLRRLTGENPGPLSDDGLRELYTELLALTKRELGGR